MLLDRIDDAPDKPRVALRIGNPGLQAVLAAILREWRYQVVGDGPCELILADKAVEPSAEEGPVVRLGTSGPLSFPLSLEVLWQELESHCHVPPRRYLRLALPQEIEVREGSRREICSLVSISSLGGRLEYPREVPRGEELELRLQLGKAPLTINARAIYTVSRGEWKSCPEYYVGIVFDRQEEKQKILRAFIARSYLERVRHFVDRDLFCEGEAFFQTQGEGVPEF